MTNLFNAFNCLVVFILMPWSFFNVISQLIMIRDTHIFLAFLTALAIAAFPLDIFESLSKVKGGRLPVISLELFMLENVFVVVISDFVKIIHVELANE